MKRSCWPSLLSCLIVISGLSFVLRAEGQIRIVQTDVRHDVSPPLSNSPMICCKVEEGRFIRRAPTDAAEELGAGGVRNFRDQCKVRLPPHGHGRKQLQG